MDMENRLSILSFNGGNDSDFSSDIYYYLSDTLHLPASLFLSGSPFLVEGMILGMCLSGSARLKIDSKVYILVPNSIFVILPNQIFEPLEKSEDNLIKFLFLATDFVIDSPLPQNFEVYYNMQECPCLEISEESMHELTEYYSFIGRICDGDSHIRSQYIPKSLMYTFIAMIASFYMESQDIKDRDLLSRSNAIVQEFSKLLMEHHRVQRKASFYADKLCITIHHLSRTLKIHTGRSVNKWITDAVILEIKALLKSTSMSVLEISEALNFQNPSFFVRYFKRYTGLTPSRYRKG